MTSSVMERLGGVSLSLQQLQEAGRVLREAAPSMPATMRDTDMPFYFRERHIHNGYRPLHQSWRYYFLSLFQRHNETINIWTHLVGFLLLLARLRQLAGTLDLAGDPHSWPLLILLLSALNYSALSVAAHTLGGKSELCHYAFFFLDYVGVAQYQYGSAAVHFYYAAEESCHARLRGVFMPVAALLSCFSCLGCCYGKYRNHTLPPWVRKVGQVGPSALAYVWDNGPVMQRLLSWSSARHDPALLYHFGQVAFFLSCALFFSFPLLERLRPGRCDFVGQSHQVFHVFLSCCTLCQIQASYLDSVGRRHVYTRLHGPGDAAHFARLYVLTVLLCLFIAAFMLRKVKRVLDTYSKVK